MTPLIRGQLDEIRAHADRALPLAVDICCNHADDEGTVGDVVAVLSALRSIRDLADELERDVAHALAAPADAAPAEQ